MLFLLLLFLLIVWLFVVVVVVVGWGRPSFAASPGRMLCCCCCFVLLRRTDPKRRIGIKTQNNVKNISAVRFIWLFCTLNLFRCSCFWLFFVLFVLFCCFLLRNWASRGYVSAMFGHSLLVKCRNGFGSWRIYLPLLHISTWLMIWRHCLMQTGKHKMAALSAVLSRLSNVGVCIAFLSIGPVALLQFCCSLWFRETRK